MTMPNFLIIGAAKSGTTSLYHYLKQHPQIYMSPVKEPSFFAVEGTKLAFRGPWRRWTSRNTITDIEAYRALFQGVSDEVAIGEASPAYLVHPSAPERIRHYIPDVKLIAVLRDPVERAYSTYLTQRLYGGEPLADLGQEIRRREAWVGENWRVKGYVDVGFYYTHLKRYFDIFDPSQIKVYIYEDFRANPVSVLQDAFRFLGVDETFIPDLSIRYNISGISRNRVWHAFLIKLNLMKLVLRPFIPATLRQHIATRYVINLQRRGLVKPPPLESDVRTELIQIYREDILKLQDLIRRDLSKWL
jgi:hypothetical protein